MIGVKPESEALMEHYRSHLSEYQDRADKSGIPRFGGCYLRELEAPVGEGNAMLIEAVARTGNYGDDKELALINRLVSKQLKVDGILQKKGKRTAAGLSNLIDDLTPILLYFGLPLQSSDRSKLVEALRVIAEGCGVTGDPRNEIRRLIKREVAYQVGIKKAIRDAVASGLSTLSITPP